MTRRSLRKTLLWLYIFLGATLAISFGSKLFGEIELINGAKWKDVYEYFKDMSLLIATGGVAYITNVFQKRNTFVQALREEWREIVETKAALFAYTQLPTPTREQYIATFNIVSQTIDNMRTVYRNVGETGSLVGLYPFAPLHDMRRALQTLDPEKGPVGQDERNLTRDAILQSFYALRETFLDELDLEEPTNPLLIYAGRRQKNSGCTSQAQRQQAGQRVHQNANSPPEPSIHDFLTRLHDKEQSTPKPWRKVAAGVTAIEPKKAERGPFS
jgi:hypothetical protein